MCCSAWRSSVFIEQKQKSGWVIRTLKYGGSSPRFRSLIQRLLLSLAFCEKKASKMKCLCLSIPPSVLCQWMTLNTSTSFGQTWQSNRGPQNKKFFTFNEKGDWEEEQDLSRTPLCERMQHELTFKQHQRTNTREWCQKCHKDKLFSDLRFY